MSEQRPNFDVLRKVLRAVSRERADEIMAEKTGSGEQLTLADAGLENEVRGIWLSRVENLSPPSIVEPFNKMEQGLLNGSTRGRPDPGC